VSDTRLACRPDHMPEGGPPPGPPPNGANGGGGGDCQGHGTPGQNPPASSANNPT
jgi:hypothetical protein